MAIANFYVYCAQKPVAKDVEVVGVHFNLAGSAILLKKLTVSKNYKPRPWQDPSNNGATETDISAPQWTTSQSHPAAYYLTQGKDLQITINVDLKCAKAGDYYIKATPQKFSRQSGKTGSTAVEVAKRIHAGELNNAHCAEFLNLLLIQA